MNRGEGEGGGEGSSRASRENGRRPSRGPQSQGRCQASEGARARHKSGRIAMPRMSCRQSYVCTTLPRLNAQRVRALPSRA